MVQVDSSSSSKMKKEVVVCCYLDCFSGAAGDMMLASLLDAWPDGPNDLRDKLIDKLKEGLVPWKDEFDISFSKVWRGGMGSIAACHVNVQSKYHHQAAPVPQPHDHHHHHHHHHHKHPPHDHEHHHEHKHKHDHHHDHHKHKPKHHHHHHHKHKHDHHHDHEHKHHDHDHKHKHKHHDHLEHKHGHHHDHEHKHKHDHHHEHEHEHHHDSDEEKHTKKHENDSDTDEEKHTKIHQHKHHHNHEHGAEEEKNDEHHEHEKHEHDHVNISEEEKHDKKKEHVHNHELEHDAEEEEKNDEKHEHKHDHHHDHEHKHHKHDHHHDHHHGPAKEHHHEHEHKHKHKHDHHHDHEHKHKHHKHHHDHHHEHKHKHDHHHDHEHKHKHDHHHDHEHKHKHHKHHHDHHHEHKHKHDHHHEHHHGPAKEHDHDHRHDHGHNHSHEEGGPLRNLPEIVSVLEQARGVLSDRAVDYSIRTFTTLAEAEAKTHGAESPDKVHFHEVGAIDSIVDIVGTIVALVDYYQVDVIYCSELPLSKGTVFTQHGLLPVPAMATYQLLKEMPCCNGPGRGELITPTAAALLKTLTSPSTRGTYPKNTTFTPMYIGIGAGTKDFYRHPNILRTIIGHTPTTTTTYTLPPIPQPQQQKQQQQQQHVTTPDHILTEPNDQPVDITTTTATTINKSITTKEDNKIFWKVDKLTKLEANMDDATPEHLAHLLQQLIALDLVVDAWISPIVMKKGRSAHCLSCLFLQQDDHDDSALNKVMEMIFKHSTTLGIRIQRNMERVALQRKMMDIALFPDIPPIPVKLGIFQENQIISCKPEFDHCQDISIKTGIPLSALTHQIIQKAKTDLANDGNYTIHF